MFDGLVESSFAGVVAEGGDILKEQSQKTTEYWESERKREAGEEKEDQSGN
jgi:hypothetical protein